MIKSSSFKTARTSTWTEQYNYSGGVFEISKYPLEYFQFSVPLSSLVSDFTLVEELEPYVGGKWNVNTLFQREIDKDRVENEIVKTYLMDDEKIKFFNPITICLLPYDQTNKSLKDHYKLIETNENESEDEVIEHYEGFEIKRVGKTGLGVIKWDKSKIFAVAIDGQHRLFSLRTYFSKNKSTDSMIPIVLIKFPETDKTLVEYMREIFIDINKNAKKVGKVREILLDDRDLISVFTKSLMGETDTKIDIEKTPLHPYLVDWTSDDPIPSESFQVSSVMTLYRIISDGIFSGKNITNTDSYDEIKYMKWISELNSVLDIDKRIEKYNSSEGISGPLLTLTTYGENCRDTDSTFSITSQMYPLLVDSFNENISTSIKYIFSNLLPYKKFLKTLFELGTFDDNSDFGRYISTSKAQRKDFKAQYSRVNPQADLAKIFDKPEQKIKSIKDDANLLFSMIGQLGLFGSLRPLQAFLGGDTSLLDVSIKLVEYLDSLCESKFFTKSAKSADSLLVWERVSVKEKGEKINASKSSSANFSTMIKLIFAYKFLVEKGVKKSDLDKIITDNDFTIEDSDKRSQISFLKKNAKRITECYAKEIYDRDGDRHNEETLNSMALVRLKKLTSLL